MIKKSSFPLIDLEKDLALRRKEICSEQAEELNESNSWDKERLGEVTLYDEEESPEIRRFLEDEGYYNDS